MRVKCEINGKWCDIPDTISRFFLKKAMIYVCSMDRLKNPFIQSVIFLNEPSKCTIAFMANKSSKILINLQKYPILALTLDVTHSKDPLQNEGIMIEAITRTSTSPLEIQQCYNDLQKKYGIDITAKILGMEITADYTKIQATPTKIIHWKGPFFQRFVCTSKKV